MKDNSVITSGRLPNYASFVLFCLIDVLQNE